MNFDLRPLNNVEPSSNPSFAWKAINGDPQFELSGWEALSGKAPRISFELSKEDMPASACMIYFDAGSGMSEHTAIGLAVTARDEYAIGRRLVFAKAMRRKNELK